MGHPRRRFVRGQVYFFTNRLAEGLPFVPNEFLNRILKGAMARAQARNPEVTCCTSDWLQNHYHIMLILFGEPSALSDFMHDLDDEVAKAITRLLGKRNVKIWAQRPHAMLLGDVESVLKKMTYGLLNPVAAKFCDKASQWKGLSTWRFLFDQTPEHCKWIPSRCLRQLPNKPFSKVQLKRQCRKLDEINEVSHEYRLEPFAWKSCFAETANMSDEALREILLKRVAVEEERYRRERKLKKERLADMEELMHQNPHKPYKPESFGRRVYCMCSDPELLKHYLREYEEFCAECQKCWAAWLVGDLSASYPPAAFIPPRRPLVNVLLLDP